MKGAVGSLLLRPLLVFTILGGAVAPGHAGPVQAPYEIGTWEGFRSAAVSFTFDDDLPNQYAKAVPMFNAVGFKLTLFTVTSWLSTWSDVQYAASCGHEIASHTVTHPQLSLLSLAKQTNELADSQIAINANVTNQSCVTLAYPNCVEGNVALTTAYYIAARGCSGSLVPSTPPDFMNISSFVCGSAGSIQTPAQFNTEANTAAGSKSWCVFLIHALDNDNGYSPLPSATLQASVNFFNTNRSKFWVETFGNVVRYIRERNASAVAETSSSGNTITVQVTNNLSTTIYNYPITLRRPLPAGWAAATAWQNSRPIRVQPVTITNTNYIMFDVVPNAGDVVLARSVPPFSMSNVALISPSNLTFQLSGLPGETYAIYTSTDFANWFPIQSNTLTGTTTNFTVDAVNSPQFYRANWLP